MLERSRLSLYRPAVSVSFALWARRQKRWMKVVICFMGLFCRQIKTGALQQRPNRKSVPSDFENVCRERRALAAAPRPIRPPLPFSDAAGQQATTQSRQRALLVAIVFTSAQTAGKAAPAMGHPGDGPKVSCQSTASIRSGIWTSSSRSGRSSALTTRRPYGKHGRCWIGIRLRCGNLRDSLFVSISRQPNATPKPLLTSHPCADAGSVPPFRRHGFRPEFGARPGDALSADR